MHRTPLTLSALALLTLAGCGEYGMGVTPGGMQDMNHARQLIANGQIPGHGDYSAEGLFSEHDLPLDGEPCGATLCPRAAAAWIDPVDESPGEVLLQVGFASDIDPDAFERPTLDLAIAIDVSGSMGGDRIVLSRKALHEVVDQLGPADTLSLVAYGSKAEVRQRAVRMDEAGRKKMRKAIDGLKTGGGTAMEDGLTLAYEQIGSDTAAAGASQRVLLLTDAQPNIGATGADSFMGIARRASEDTGLTVWGVGLDFGAELTGDLATVRGANAYMFLEVDEMRARVRDEFELMVTPLAYDLDVEIAPHEDLRIDRTWGSVQDAGRLRAHLGASTLFPSRRDGGLGLSLVLAGPRPVIQKPSEEPLGSLTLSWSPADGGERQTAEIEAHWPDHASHADLWATADQQGPFTMAALVDELLALDAAADWCLGELDRETAEARIADAAERLHTRASARRDTALQVEAELIDALLANVQADGTCSGVASDTGLVTSR